MTFENTYVVFSVDKYHCYSTCSREWLSAWYCSAFWPLSKILELKRSKKSVGVMFWRINNQWHWKSIKLEHNNKWVHLNCKILFGDNYLLIFIYWWKKYLAHDSWINPIVFENKRSIHSGEKFGIGKVGLIEQQ